MNTVTLNRSYLPALDGLRGIAIILVLCCHNFNFLPYFEFGWIGVDLFFVLSGYLITRILLQTRDNRLFLQHFYIRRILRIFPLYYGVLLLYFLLAPLFPGLQTQYHYYEEQQVMSWLHMQNWMYIFNHKPDNFLLLKHFWSLSVEEQFYLLWPFVILAVRNLRRLAIVIYFILAACIIARFGSWVYFGNGDTNFLFQYMTRLDGFCIGGLIAVWHYTQPEKALRKLSQLAAVLLGMHLAVMVVSKTAFPGLPHFRFFGYSNLAVFFGLLVISAVKSGNRFSNRVLCNSSLRYIGKISYGLYVFHWPILVIGKLLLRKYLADLGCSSLQVGLIIGISCLVVAFALSILSYHFFERKLLRLKDVVTNEGYFSRLRQRFRLALKPASSR